ncbi:site-specific integrase [Streptomyces cellulosae]|uniref:site-specific integrase n=1 Tax=Streptomyces cellulosae TaxID=1968 RepID=UPI0022582DEA|nr:site-specific integrase [Streptomyces cellulosae]MCX4482222.1 site-specific integrase [Streptomyces cellulosae]
MSTDQAPETAVELAAPDLPAPLVTAPSLVLPDQYGPELTERLDALDDAAEDFAARQRPANTRRAYAGDWKTWTRFALGLGIPLTAAAYKPGVLRTYVTWMWDQGGEDGRPLAPTTIDRKLAGLAVTLRRDHGVVIPPEFTEAARELLKDLKRQAAARKEPPRGRGKAPAMRLDALRAIVDACPDTLTGLRDRATVLLSFAVAARRHEAAALMARDLVLVEGEGLDVDVRVSKTHPRQVAVPYGSSPETCPVRAWQAWQEAAGIEPDTPALRRMHRTGSVTRAGLSPQSVGAIITEAGRRAGVSIRFTGHSVRSGMITEARRAGKDRKAISNISGHVDGSPVLDGYIQTADRWSDQDNALKGVL